jgi:DNA-binding winged helix-turn-helix (wHTH) protein/tetratricopeptide (TPR) repeat protein
VFTGFRLGPLTIDLDHGAVSGEQGPSGLTPRAEALLLLFSRRANTLVSRDDILETVWVGRVVEDAAITHCVWQIRRALGPAGKDILQTRSKRGYVLVVPDAAWIRQIPGPPEPAESEPVSEPQPIPETAQVAQASPDPAAAAPEPHVASGPQAPSDAKFVAAPQAAPEPQTSSGPQVAPMPSRRRWRPVLVVALVSLLALAAIPAWRWFQASGAIVFDPQIEMSAAVLAPPSFDWLRETLLRKTMEQAHLRDVDVVVFQRAQVRNPFRGPHLQVRIERADRQMLDAELTLEQGRVRIREHYRGTAEGLPDALQTLLDRHLPAPTRSPGSANDAYVAGKLADARFDRATALLEFQRALGVDGRMTDARIALAGLLFDQGRAEEAREAARPLAPAAETDPVRRCRIERLFARIAPDRLGADPCPRAAMVARVERLQLRDALREIERLYAQPAGAGEWLEQEDALILALLRLQELERAKYEIDRARAIAEVAGWPHAALRLDTNLGPLHMHRGERKAAAETQARVADGFARLGDLASAAESRVWVQRAQPIVPGPLLAARRAQLHAIVGQARASGDLRAEIEALLLMARMDRDRPEAWVGHLDRARQRIRDARLDAGNSLHPYFVVAEVVAVRHYKDAMAEVQLLQQVQPQHPRGLAWALSLQIESHFWRDEIDDAVDAIDAMERAGLDITASPNPCFYAWVLTEAGRRDRANAYLERCNDGKRSPEQTDFGLIAAARQRVMDGEPAGAWRLLQPRIDALLAIREPSRQEAEALALMTRQAVGLPGADPRRLQSAGQVVDRVAGLDGAGPALRLGAELLRGALCESGADGPCPARPLPEWAAEDRLAARLAKSRAALP